MSEVSNECNNVQMFATIANRNDLRVFAHSINPMHSNRPNRCESESRTDLGDRDRSKNVHTSSSKTSSAVSLSIRVLAHISNHVWESKQQHCTLALNWTIWMNMKRDENRMFFIFFIFPVRICTLVYLSHAHLTEFYVWLLVAMQ